MIDNNTYTHKPTTELPTVASTETFVRERDHGLETIATAWFSSGVQLRYRRDASGRLWEETFRADDPDRVWESHEVTSRAGVPGESLDDPAAFLEAKLDEYNYYVENHAVAELGHGWSAISEVLIETR